MPSLCSSRDCRCTHTTMLLHAPLGRRSFPDVAHLWHKLIPSGALRSQGSRRRLHGPPTRAPAARGTATRTRCTKRYSSWRPCDLASSRATAWPGAPRVLFPIAAHRACLASSLGLHHLYPFYRRPLRCSRSCLRTYLHFKGLMVLRWARQAPGLVLQLQGPQRRGRQRRLLRGGRFVPEAGPHRGVHGAHVLGGFYPLLCTVLQV